MTGAGRGRLIGFVLGLMVAGCGPVYETVYDYQGPPGPAAAACSAGCRLNEDLCRNQCQQDNWPCLHSPAGAGPGFATPYWSHGDSDRFDAPPGSLWCDPPTACYERCAAEQRRCLTATCGGQLTSRRACVAFCPKGTE
jgi:hypothetical protein